MPHISTAAVVVLSASLLLAGCRTDVAAPSHPTDLTLAHTADEDELGADYWTPERMDRAVGEMPTEDD